MKMSQTCPACGSDAVTTEQQTEIFTVPYGPHVTYPIINNICGLCHSTGDFGRANEETLTRIKEQAIKASVPLMLEQLSDNGCTMAYIERSLDLPSRTIARWKAGETSAAAVAALRLITTFPWLLEVADYGFAPGTARAILVR